MKDKNDLKEIIEAIRVQINYSKNQRNDLLALNIILDALQPIVCEEQIRYANTTKLTFWLAKAELAQSILNNSYGLLYICSDEQVSKIKDYLQQFIEFLSHQIELAEPNINK